VNVSVDTLRGNCCKPRSLILELVSTVYYELSCKGVHAEVSEFELNQCVIQTYLLVGDILRLTESDSGIEDAENAVV